MIKINEIIIVEGKYDSAAVKRCIDTIVIETGGFRIFKDTELMNTIRLLAEKRGIVILTDSDKAGFAIRNKKGGLQRRTSWCRGNVGRNHC